MRAGKALFSFYDAKVGIFLQTGYRVCFADFRFRIVHFFFVFDDKKLPRNRSGAGEYDYMKSADSATLSFAFLAVFLVDGLDLLTNQVHVVFQLLDLAVHLVDERVALLRADTQES